MTELKPRFQGHELMNAVIRADWNAAIRLSPDAFDAYLFLPEQDDLSAGGPNYEDNEVMELDINQDAISYAEPIIVRVLDCPDEMETFFVSDTGGPNLGEGDSVLLLRIASDSDIPTGSALEWLEEIAEGETRSVYWYVQDILGYGTANVGHLYVCVPLRNFNQASEPEADSEPAEQNATPEPPAQSEDVMYI